MRDILDGQTSLGSLQIQLLQADLEVVAAAATASPDDPAPFQRERSTSLDENSKRRGLIRLRSRRGTTRMSQEERTDHISTLKQHFSREWQQVTDRDKTKRDVRRRIRKSICAATAVTKLRKGSVTGADRARAGSTGMAGSRPHRISVVHDSGAHSDGTCNPTTRRDTAILSSCWQIGSLHY